MRKLLLSLLLLLCISVSANHWNPDPYQYADNMNVVAVIEINGDEQANTNLELGAFCDGECRGSERLAYVQAFDRYLLFLTLYGEYGNQFSFRLYDHGTHREYDFNCANSINFVPNQVLGNLMEPYMFSFTGTAFNVTVDVVPEEGGTAIGAGMFMQGDLCTLTASPNYGYRFEAWREDGIVLSTESEYSFFVEADHRIEACFVPLVFHIHVEINPVEGGSVVGDGDYNYGDTARLHATAASNFYFIHWEEDGVAVSSDVDLQFVVEADRCLTALFALECYQVEAEASPADGGSVSGAGNFIGGTTCTLEALPRQGYVFVNWTDGDDVVSQNMAYSFIVEADRHLVAHFSQIVYHITVVAEPETGGTVMGGGDFHYGETCEVMALPAYSYSFDRWKENGGTVSTNPTFSFTVIRSRSLVAHFDYFDGIGEDGNVGYVVRCVNRQVVVTHPDGTTFVPKQVIDLQGRAVDNFSLSAGLYLVRLDGVSDKVIVR